MIKGPIRFGVYSFETYQRRQELKSDLSLIGQKAIHIFQRLNHSGNEMASQDPKFVDLLEKSLLKCDRNELDELDQQLSKCPWVVPDKIAAALEFKALKALKNRLQRNSYSHSQHERTLLDHCNEDMKRVEYQSYQTDSSK